MKNLILIAGVVTTLLLLTNLQEDKQSLEAISFQNWKLKHSKLYSQSEEQYRFNVYLQNMAIVQEHNQRYAEGKESYTIGLNKFADLEFREFASLYLNSYKGEETQQNHSIKKSQPNVEGTVNWITKLDGWSTVRDQGLCRSSYAFAMAGAISARQATQKDATLFEPLSMQEIVDCYGNANACVEMSVANGLEFYQKDKGDHELHFIKDYPFVGGKNACQEETIAQTGVYVGDFSFGQVDMDTLQNAILTSPIVAPINVSSLKFQFYTGGIFNGPCGTEPNYDSLVAGYNSEEGSYLVRMTWGTDWGDNGDIRLQVSDNICGIQTRPYQIHSVI